MRNAEYKPGRKKHQGNPKENPVKFDLLVTGAGTNQLPSCMKSKGELHASCCLPA
jgi:hypothetical protein